MDTTDRLDRINSKLLSCLPMRVREYAIIDPQERVVRRRKIAAKASNNRIRNPEIICCGAGFPHIAAEIRQSRGACVRQRLPSLARSAKLMR
jgi:hypothetical protein